MNILSRLSLVAVSLVMIVADATGADSRPNLLWITCEDMSPRLGCYGDKYAVTPYLDMFARQSVRYTRAFATAPACSPSRACLITGAYATSLGNPQLRSEITLPQDVRGYGEHFRAAGYFTSNNVKTDYNLKNERDFIRLNWSECDKAAHWRQREKGKPFFSVFNLMETHQSRTNVWPWEEFERQIGNRLSPGTRAESHDVPLPSFYPDTPLSRRTMARLYDCIQAMDTEVGRILRELEEDGLAEDTIVFFYSDHGDGMPRGKRTLYDSGMRVPLLIRFPEKWKHLAPAKPGETVDRLVSFVDFAPTALSLAGLPIPKSMQGVPFLGAAKGPAREMVAGARDRVDEAFELSRSVRDERWLYIRNYLPHLSWMQPEGYSDQGEFRRELFKLAGKGKLGPAQRLYAAPQKAVEELYDTEADPDQIRNLAAEPEQADRLTDMRKRLRTWILETRDLGFLPESLMHADLQGRAPRELGLDKERYPLEKILDAAELVGDPAARGRQVALLTDAEPAVRYWAAVGLLANPAGGESAQGPLIDALKDSFPAVRIQAAAAVLAQKEVSPEIFKAALNVLTDAMTGENPAVALEASRALQLLGERARPALGTIREVWEKVRSRPASESDSLYLRFSTEEALRGLGENIPRTPTL